MYVSHAVDLRLSLFAISNYCNLFFFKQSASQTFFTAPSFHHVSVGARQGETAAMSDAELPDVADRELAALEPMSVDAVDAARRVAAAAHEAVQAAARASRDKRRRSPSRSPSPSPRPPRKPKEAAVRRVGMYGSVASLAERVYDDVEKQVHFDSGLCTSNTPNAILF